MEHEPINPQHTKDWGLVDPVGYTAWELFQTYKQHTGDDGLTSDEGLFWMHEIFGRVPESKRANVFIEFLARLDEAGLEYDKAQFNVESVKGQVKYDG